MESSCFDAKRGILYEFGGMYAAHDDLKYGQHVRSDFEQLQHSLAEEVGRRTQPAMGDTGGGMIGGSGADTGMANEYHSTTDAPLWDTHTGEHLRTTTELPINGPWTFEDGFVTSQPQFNNSLKFVQQFRTHIVKEDSIVLQLAVNLGWDKH
jgi:hypothetical protein